MTGSDRYYQQRLTTAQRYLRNVPPDVVASLALSDADPVDFEDGITALGGTPQRGWGISDMLEEMQNRKVAPVYQADLRKTQQQLINGGWMHPDYEADGAWTPAWQTALRNQEQYLRENRFKGKRPGSLAFSDAIGYLANTLPSKVWQALAGTLKSQVEGLQNVGRHLSAGEHIDEVLRKEFRQEYGRDPTGLTADTFEGSELDKHGTRVAINDMITVLSLIPVARGAGAVGGAVKESFEGLAKSGARGAFTGVAGTQSKKLIPNIIRQEGTIGTFTKRFGWKEFSQARGARSYLKGADALATLKSSPFGIGATGVLNAATQTALSERAIAAVGQGEILPYVQVGNLPKNELSKAIDNAPVPFKDFEKAHPIIGNPLDLSTFVWTTTKALPFRYRDIKNGITRMVPLDEMRPITRATKLKRPDFIAEAGGEAKAKQTINYWKAQAAAAKEADELVKAKKVSPDSDKFEDAFRRAYFDISGEFKANPERMRKAMDDLDPNDYEHWVTKMLDDYPEMLGQRGQGGVHIGAWIDSNDLVDSVSVGQVKVRPFRGGSKIWTDATREYLDEAVDAISTPKSADEALAQLALTAGEGMPKFHKKSFYDNMRGRLGQTLTGEETLAFRRMDNPLASAQDITKASAAFQRLGNIRTSLKAAMERKMATTLGTDINVAVPKDVQVGDLRRAGLDRSLLDFSMNPADRRVLSPDDAGQLLGHVETVLDEIRTTAQNYIRGAKNLTDDKLLLKKMKRAAGEAGRDVDLPDEAIQAKLEQYGYQPVILHKKALTMRDVGGAGLSTELDHASKMGPALEFLGLTNYRPDQRMIARTRTRNLANRLEQLAAEKGIGETGEDLMLQLKDAAKQIAAKRSDIKLPLTDKNIWTAGAIYDLRQLSNAQLREATGWTQEFTRDVMGEIRVAAAFGFDAAHPIRTGGALAEAFRLQGLPAVEDAIRTLAASKGRLPKNVPGPARAVLSFTGSGADKLFRIRDFVQFQMSPLFTVGNMVEAKVLQKANNLPIELRPGQTLKQMRQTYEDFDDVIEGILGGKGTAYLYGMDDELSKFAKTGFFGFNPAQSEMVDAYRLHQRGMDPKQIRETLDGIYRYKPRSAFEKSANYVFFPLSFNLKLGRTLTDWYMQEPTRILMTQLGLKAWEHIKETSQVDEWTEKYLPALSILNQINTLGRGFGVTTSPIGGRNKLIYNAGKTFAGELADNPLFGAFVPVTIRAEDQKEAVKVARQLMPLFRFGHDVIETLGDQWRVGQEGASESYQIDHYYLEMRAFRDEVETMLGDQGLKPTMRSLQSSKVSQEFRDWVEDEKAAISQKYPTGDNFATLQALDYSQRGEELKDIANKPNKTRAEMLLLYFAYREGTVQAAEGDPPVEELDDLHALAVDFAKRERDFGFLYKRYFQYEYGPLGLSKGAAA